MTQNGQLKDIYTWHITYDTWQMTNDLWNKFQITHFTHDTWDMMYDAWHLMHDACCMMMMMMINDSRQNHPASHTSERTIVPRTVIFKTVKISNKAVSRFILSKLTRILIFLLHPCVCPLCCQVKPQVSNWGELRKPRVSVHCLGANQYRGKPAKETNHISKGS